MTVEFDEPPALRTATPANKPSALYATIISFGLAKDEKGAQKIALGLVVVALLLAGFFLISSGGPEVLPPQPLPEDLL